MTDMVEKAIAIAVRAHNGQKRKDGTPYILHPLRVMMACALPFEPLNSPRAQEVLMAAGVLHDVCEDCGVTLETIAHNVDPDVAALVDRLTRRRDERYSHYVARAAANPLSRIVKIQDVLDNLVGAEEVDRRLGTRLVSRYNLALSILRPFKETRG